jgi:hypothetical protein
LAYIKGMITSQNELEKIILKMNSLKEFCIRKNIHSLKIW